MAGIYNGHILEFPLIRVDSFTTPPQPPKQPWLLPDPNDPAAPPRPAPSAQLFLLTHVHTDHLIGLSEDFSGKILCSPDTKRMLLRLEAEAERKNVHFGHREVRRRKYEGLRRRKRVVGGKEFVVDMIETINVNETKDYLLGYEEGEELRVSITLLDANHCPGSSMFLITSPTAAVLHTGDIRADRTFLTGLRRIPALQQFFVPWNTVWQTEGLFRRLDRIYLDTSALFKGDMPDREEVLQSLVLQMSMYPEDTVFFLDVWCFGWEYVVEEVARHFGSQVLVDRYKRGIYNAIQSDPFLAQCTTEDADSTRFHACERWFRCDMCKNGKDSGKGRLVVQVKMVEVCSTAWDEYEQQFLVNLGNAARGEGPWPTEIKAPLARHSLIPELRNLVKLFRPKSISPNCLLPSNGGRDFYVLPEIFRDVVADGAAEKMMLERDCWFISNPQFGREGLAMLRVLSKVAAAMLPDGASHHSWDGQVAKDTRQSTLQEQQYRLLGSSAVEGTGLGTALEATTTSRICVQTLHTTQEESKVASVKEEQETSASITWDLGCCHNRQPKEEERQLADVKPEIETPTEAKLYTSPETQSSMRPPSTEVKPCIEVKRERTPSSQQGDKSKRRRTAFKVNKSHIRSLISTPFS